MKAIMVMFDSLNRHMLPSYGNDWVIAPNFERLAKKTIQFDKAYVGSMPCMPARREIHTGRSNFLHTSWGPLQPFDDSMPEILKQNGIHSHLVSDHWHYWEAGGANYHTKYSTFQFVRGQEGDGVYGYLPSIPKPEIIDGMAGEWGRNDVVNRMKMKNEEDQPMAVTFQKGIEFLNDNHACDNWFLQIEAFDPHEPFFVNDNYKELYPQDYNGPLFDWPIYHRVRETPEQAQSCVNNYAALLSMCDNYLGKVLDFMDTHDMWKDTMLIVNTDHGFLLGEHDWWGKMLMPFYNELANIPMFMWHPELSEKGVSTDALVQTQDIAPTILEYFKLPIPKDMQGISLKQAFRKEKTRDYAIFGIHGGHVNITDGKHVYMRASEVGIYENDNHVFNYTWAFQHQGDSYSLDELNSATIHEGFSFTKGCKIIKVKGGLKSKWDEVESTSDYPWTYPPEDLFDGGHLLFDLESDREQLNPINNNEIEERMIEALINMLKKEEAPEEQYERLGLVCNSTSS